MIRIGSSCALSVPMAIGYAVEARILTDGSADWRGTSKYAIDNKQYLIINPCVNDGMGKKHIPTDAEWMILIHNTCQYIKSIGGNANNSHITIINEPTKFLTKEQYVNFINIAYPIIKSYGFIVGAGNMEFVTSAMLGDWYGYICVNAKFDILDIHIQDSCDSDTKTKQYTDYALNLATQYKKRLNCTEAFCTRWDIRTSGGWNNLLMQLKHAERIGCENFCNVFNNLDKAIFKVNTDNWEKLSFKVNGIINSNYWAHWKILMDTSHPVPNIYIPIEEDDMELNYVKSGTINEETRTVQEILLDSGYVLTVTGKCDANTVTAIKEFQADNGLKADAWVGKVTWAKLLSETSSGSMRFSQLIARKAIYK